MRDLICPFLACACRLLTNKSERRYLDAYQEMVAGIRKHLVKRLGLGLGSALVVKRLGLGLALALALGLRLGGSRPP